MFGKLGAWACAFSFLLCAGAAAQTPAAWSDAEARATARAAAGEIESVYTDAAIARRIGAALRAAARRGDFDGAQSGEEFAQRLLSVMRGVYDDKHFNARFFPEGAPESGPPLEDMLAAAPDPNAGAWARFVNGGAERAERLVGNIGYLSVMGMPDLVGGDERALAAIDFVRETDALILDLSHCGGGDPGMAGFYQSLLTDGQARTYARFEWRSGAPALALTTPALERTQIYDPSKPLFVLIGEDTASACEELAFNLAERGRATFVGATTMGAANPGRIVRVGERIGLFMPSARYVSAQTGRNWEGVGVAADVAASTEEARRTAHLLALRAVASAPARAPFQRFIDQELAREGIALEPAARD